MQPKLTTETILQDRDKIIAEVELFASRKGDAVGYLNGLVETSKREIDEDQPLVEKVAICLVQIHFARLNGLYSRRRVDDYVNQILTDLEHKRPYGFKSIGRLVEFEYSRYVLWEHLVSGYPECVIIEFDRMLKNGQPNFGSEQFVELVGLVCEAYMELDDAPAIHKLLKWTHQTKHNQSTIAELALLEARVLIAAGEVNSADKYLDRAARYAENYPGLVKKVQWEKIWNGIRKGEDLKNLVNYSFSEKHDEVRLEIQAGCNLACYASGKKRNLRYVRKIETIRRKRNVSHINLRTESFIKCASIIETLIWQNNDDNDLKLVSKLFREYFGSLDYFQKTLVAASLLRWANESQSPSMIRLIIGRYPRLSGHSDDLGLVSGLMEESALDQLFPVSNAEIVDGFKYSLASRGFRIAKISVDIAFRNILNTVRKTTRDLSGSGDYGEVETTKLVQQILRESRSLKGPALKFAQIISALEPSSPLHMGSDVKSDTTLNPETVEKTISSELGELAAEVLAQWDPKPIASASVGQVHTSTINDVKVAVKVQHPNIEKAIEADHKIIFALTPLIKALFPKVEVRKHITASKQSALNECDFQNEAEMQHLFARYLREHYSEVAVAPAVLPKYSSAKVLTMEFIEGISMDAFVFSNDSAARSSVAEAIFEIYWVGVLGHGLLMGDPQPENLIFMPDGKIGFIDFGLMEILSRERRTQWIKAFKALIANDLGATRSAIEEIGLFPPKDCRRVDFEALLRNIRAVFHLDRIGQKSSYNREVSSSANQAMTTRAPNRLLVSPQVQDSMLMRFAVTLNNMISKFDAEADWGGLFCRVVDKAENQLENRDAA